MYYFLSLIGGLTKVDLAQIPAEHISIIQPSHIALMPSMQITVSHTSNQILIVDCDYRTTHAPQ